MKTGHFYYLDDRYFADFPDPHLMQNKETINGEVHDRPCFFAFKDEKTNLFWLVPFSSQIQKYRRIYNKKIVKYKSCDTIVFGHVLGHEKAFLIQNMCPTKACYIKNEYIDKKDQLPVQLAGNLEKEIISKAKKVLILHRKGSKLIFPDILSIEKILLSGD